VTLQSDGWLAGSTTGIVHANMTLTRSKVKVEVTGLLNFRKLASPCMLASMTVSPFATVSGLCLAVCDVVDVMLRHGQICKEVT